MTTDLSLWTFDEPEHEARRVVWQANGPGNLMARLIIDEVSAETILYGVVPPEVYAELLRRAGVTP